LVFLSEFLVSFFVQLKADAVFVYAVFFNLFDFAFSCFVSFFDAIIVLFVAYSRASPFTPSLHYNRFSAQNFGINMTFNFLVFLRFKLGFCHFSTFSDKQ
jgi:hypothetical protein